MRERVECEDDTLTATLTEPSLTPWSSLSASSILQKLIPVSKSPENRFAMTYMVLTLTLILQSPHEALAGRSTFFNPNPIWNLLYFSNPTLIASLPDLHPNPDPTLCTYLVPWFALCLTYSDLHPHSHPHFTYMVPTWFICSMQCDTPSHSPLPWWQLQYRKNLVREPWLYGVPELQAHPHLHPACNALIRLQPHPDCCCISHVLTLMCARDCVLNRN